MLAGRRSNEESSMLRLQSRSPHHQLWCGWPGDGRTSLQHHRWGADRRAGVCCLVMTACTLVSNHTYWSVCVHTCSHEKMSSVCITALSDLKHYCRDHYELESL